MKNISYNDCLEKIYKLGRFGIKLELNTIAGILERLGSPHLQFPTIHIAGTNGKGSIGAYISSIMSQSGYRTGFYTSPHLVKFNERIAIDGKTVSDDEVVDAYLAVNAADTGTRKATFFEIATAMAFHLFLKRGVTFAVVETGMGGRFDATNIVSPQVSVISNLSIEHTDYLGNTIDDLAREKGGVIKPGIPVVTGVAQQSALDVLKKIAARNSAPLYIYRKHFKTRKHANSSRFSYSGIGGIKMDGLTTPLRGEHQRENLALALAACEVLSLKEGRERIFSTQNIFSGLENAKWPGRLDYILDKPCVIIDGAHNQKASRILADHLLKNVKNKNKLTLVIGILDDKPYKAMLKNLVPLADRLVLTKADTPRSIDPHVLKEAAQRYTTAEINIMEDVGSACDFAISTSRNADTVCVGGSLYVAGEAKQKIDTDFKFNNLFAPVA